MSFVHYRPGDKVPSTGVYSAIHGKVQNRAHAQDHEVIAVIGGTFPQCKECGAAVRFELVKKAHYITNHSLFK